MLADRGSASVAIAVPLAFVAMALVALGSLAILYGARVQASTAADAAALAAAVATYPPAGADSPLAEAGRYAEANGASLVSCDCQVDSNLRPRVATVIVVKRIKVPFFGELGVQAGARSEFDPIAWLGG